MPRPSPFMSTRPTGQQVYEDLRGKIVRGVLRPGSELPEAQVAEAYGLTRQPLREVFWRLGEDGFLRLVPQGGAQVSPISVPAVYDGLFVRESLECRAVAEAARRALPSDIGRLQQMLAEQEAALDRADMPAHFALDEAFHRLLMAMAGRHFVWEVIAAAKVQLDRVRFLVLDDQDQGRRIVAEHRRIVDAVAAHDAEAVVPLMQAHLRMALAAINRIAAKHPDFFDGLGTHIDEAR